jgi:hypothetical protein
MPDETRAMDLIDGLERTRDATLRHFELGERDLEKTYGPGKWSIRYLLHHLADSESVLYYRIRRVISEPSQVIWVYDQAAWADALDYSTMPLELSLDVYLASRAAIIHHARRHYATSGDISFEHSATGLRTLKDEFDKVVSHNEHHLRDIEKALRLSS